MATNVTNFGACTGALGFTVAGPTLAVVGNTNPLTIQSAGFLRNLTFAIGTGATALNVDTLHNSVRSIPLSTADTLTISTLAGTATPTTMYDVLNQPSPVFARMRGMLMELLTTGDTVSSADPTPTAAVSITVGNAASNKWTSPVDGTGTFTILNGETWAKATRTAAGMAITGAANDQLKILNNSGTLAAVYRIILFGCGA